MFNDSIAGKEFFGRAEELRLLDKRIAALKEGYRQNIAIAGQRLAGKTCLLYHFLDTLKDPSILPIYIEVIKEPFRAFAERFLGTLLYAFLKVKNEELREDFDYLLEKAKPHIPQTVEAISNIRKTISAKNLEKVYVDILNITSAIKKETGVKCIVIFDEFQNLSQFGIKKPFSHFGKVMMIQKDTMYIISSSDKSAFQKIVSEELDLLFGNFEIIELSGFDFASSTEFLNKKFAGFKLIDGLRSFLVTFTDGNPFYMDMLCAKARELAAAASTDVINTKIVVDAIENLYFNSKGTANQYFTNLIQGLHMNSSLLDALIAISRGSHVVNRIKDELEVSLTEVSQRLKKLIDLNMIFKNGTFYFFIDNGFSFWIREVCNRKQTSLLPSATMRSEQFKNDVHSYLSKFLFNVKKSDGQRIAELFAKFRDEIVEIDGRKHRLPQFNKIDLISINKSSSLILAHRDKRLWCCFIKEETAKEEDIALFTKELTRTNLEVINKVFMPLDGIELNARLLAKEKKIWIWNPKNLNFVMDIYNQPKITRCT